MKIKNSLLGFLMLLTMWSYGQDFEVSPVVLNFSLEPGEIGKKSVTITNYSSKEYTFVLEQYDEGYSGEEIQRWMPAGSNSNSISEWLSISPSLVKLSPNQSKTVDVTLSVPGNDDGTKWGAIGIRTAQERSEFEVDKSLSAGILVSPRIKVTVMQSPKSNLGYKGKIIAVEQIEDTEGGLIGFEVALKNEGGKKIKPEVYLILANMVTGKEQKEQKKELTLMPGQIKKVILTLASKLEKGEYAAAAVMDYGNNAPIEVFQVSLVQE